MKNTTICLIGLFLATNSFAQTVATKNMPAKQATTSSVKKTQKPFNVPSFKIPVSKGDKIEKISSKDYKKKIKSVEQVPEFVKKQSVKIEKVPSNIKPKVFPPNITNFTQEDIKNDPTLQKGKIFYVKEEAKPSLSVVEEYNQKRERFLKKREAAKDVYLEKRQQQIQLQQQALRESVAKEQARRRLGLPISRLENTKGPNGNEAGITREAMSAMSSGAPLPKVPPTGNVK